MVTLLLTVVLMAQRLFFSDRDQGPIDLLMSLLPCLLVAVNSVENKTKEEQEVARNINKVERKVTDAVKAADRGLQVAAQVYAKALESTKGPTAKRLYKEHKAATKGHTEKPKAKGAKASGLRLRVEAEYSATGARQAPPGRQEQKQSGPPLAYIVHVPAQIATAIEALAGSRGAGVAAGQQGRQPPPPNSAPTHAGSE
jgi:hypothetical protein|eukprot:COSAG01_NODE_3465_length_6056_cov_32.665268_5_plen_199_part_00